MTESMSPEFRQFLASLEQDSDPTARDSAKATKGFMVGIWIATRQQVPDPQALMSEHGYLALAWESRGQQLSVEVYPDARMDWFWRDTSTGEIKADERVPCTPLPEIFLEGFKKAFETT